MTHFGLILFPRLTQLDLTGPAATERAAQRLKAAVD